MVTTHFITIMVQLMRNKSSITPEEIRTIREHLGLTQVEAGELLGGGPRAFTKYEAGAVQPAASVVNLLRLLDVDPTAMTTLGGRMPRPIASAATGPFEVTGEHVTVLTERTFPRLLRRLLSTEAQTHGLPEAGIHVAETIHAADGGEDGRIEWEGGPDRTPFLPSRLCRFQLKAGRVGPAEAGREVLARTGRTEKDMVWSVLEAGGHYIMLCAHRYTQQQVETRESRIRDALRTAGLDIDGEQIDFRDADQIAAWVNRHPSVAVWLKEQTQPGTLGPFRSWSHWAGRAEHDRSLWVEDERLPGLRAHLGSRIAEPRSVFRIVGLSGIGKSRLTLEALDPTEEDETTGRTLSYMVMYADESEVGSAAVNDVVQKLADSRERAIVVVNHCAPETHRILDGMVRRSDSRLSLITIDDEEPPGTLDETTFKVEKAPSTVTEAVLDRVSPGLPSEDRRRLARFSRGFPEIAIQIGRAWNERRPLAHATDGDLVDTFVLGRTPWEEPDLLRKSAALLATFGLVRLKESGGGQLREIAALGRILTSDDLRVAIRRLVKRGVARQRGRFVVLQPHPVAMRLAERQWSEWGAETWDEVLAGGTSPDLKSLAARQLALLDTTDISKEVLAHACRFGGPFDGIEGVSGAGHTEVLSALAEIDARLVVDQIQRSLDDIEDLSELDGDTRNDLVRALAKIAFHPETFEDGARLLLRLAVAENEQGLDNDATGQFKALFPLVLGNTAADGHSRLSMLDEAIETNDPAQHGVVVQALITGAKTSHFLRHVGAETHGTRPALESWQPVTREEANGYIRGCVTRLADMAIRGEKAGAAARTGLGRHLRSLIGFGLIDTVETVVERVGDVPEQWVEALEGLCHFLKYDASDLEPGVIERVETLIVTLQPRDLEARIRFLVTAMPWDFPSGEKLDFEARDRRQLEAVRALAAEAVEHPRILERMLPRLSRGRQRKAFDFGKAAASEGLADSPSDWLERIIQAVVEVPEDERDFDLLSGYLAGSAESHPGIVDDLKRRAARSPDLAPALPLICRRLGVTPFDIGLVIGAFQAGLVPARWMEEWSLGGALSALPATALPPLFDTLLDHGAEAFAVAVVLMRMYAHDTHGALEGLRPQIRKCAKNLTRWMHCSGRTQYEHDFAEIMEWMLKKGRQDPDARATALLLAKTLANVADWEDDRAVRPLVPRLLSDFPEIVWPLVGQAIVSDPRRTWLLEGVLGERALLGQDTNPPILSLPEDVLFAWCHAHPDRAPAFAASIVPVLTAGREDAPERSLHPVMARLLDEFGHCKEVLNAVGRNMNCFTWSGSATSHYELYKEPIGALCIHPGRQVRRWAERMLRRLDDEIKNTRDDDDERGAQWDIS